MDSNIPYWKKGYWSGIVWNVYEHVLRINSTIKSPKNQEVIFCRKWDSLPAAAWFCGVSPYLPHIVCQSNWLWPAKTKIILDNILNVFLQICKELVLVLHPCVGNLSNKKDMYMYHYLQFYNSNWNFNEKFEYCYF